MHNHHRARRLRALPPSVRAAELRDTLRNRFPNVAGAVVVRQGQHWAPMPAPQTRERYRHGKGIHAVALAAGLLGGRRLRRRATAPTGRHVEHRLQRGQLSP